MKSLKKLLKNETKKIIRGLKHPTFIYLTIVGNFILLSTATAVYFLERDINPNMRTFFDYIWWASSTITTVAYGDILPITLAGRIIAIFLMYTGTVLFITFTGVILTILMKDEVDKELRPLEKGIRADELSIEKISQTLVTISNRLEKLENQTIHSENSPNNKI